jgi:hypothetical protein
VGLASVYRKGALISVPAPVEIRAAVGRTPISPPETILAGMCTKFSRSLRRRTGKLSTRSWGWTLTGAYEAGRGL